MPVKSEEYLRYIEEYEQSHCGWAPNMRHLANKFELSFREVGELNAQCAHAGYSPLLWPLEPVYEGNWWELISGHEGTFTNPESLYLAIRDPEVEVDGISVEASSGKVFISLRRGDKLAGFTVSRGGRSDLAQHLRHHPLPLGEESDDGEGAGGGLVPRPQVGSVRTTDSPRSPRRTWD
jgi:hypothetical protein